MNPEQPIGGSESGEATGQPPLEINLRLPEARLNNILSREITAVANVQEMAVQECEERYKLAIQAGQVGIWDWDLTSDHAYIDPHLKTMLGYSEHEISDRIDDWRQLVHPDDVESVLAAIQACLAGTVPDYISEYRIRHRDGSYRWFLNRGVVFRNEKGEPYRMLGVRIDISDRKRDEMMHRQAEEALRQKAAWEQLLRSLTQRIHQSFDLDYILGTAVTEVRQTLRADRALVFQLHTDGSGQVIQESVVPEYPATQAMDWLDECFPPECYEHYCRGIPRIVLDVAMDPWADCIAEFMQSVGVKSKAVAPIIQRQEDGSIRVWGLLIVHACSFYREWQMAEAELLQQVGNQVAIAIQQSELYQQVQQLNATLETQVRERTAELEQALEFESLLKRITDKVRDSLDEAHILETVVQELAKGLDIAGCDVALHDPDQGVSVIRYEYIAAGVPPAKGGVLSLVDPDEILAQSLRGETFQFCRVVLDPVRPIEYRFAILSCPIFDNHGVLGDIWLLRQREQSFSDSEIRLVQQITNQCAIAIRQARLFQAAQSQVTELERLNRLKDDFLSTVSHELRTPVSSIKMAAQMLESLLFRSEPGGMGDEASQTPLTLDAASLQRLHRYFQILQDECQREISLITNLLDLTRLDAEVEPLVLTPISLQIWLPHVVESFMERLQNHQQTLQFNLPDDLPPLTTDLSYLQRILTELLTNAYKYTPAGETITVAARVVMEREERWAEKEEELPIKDKETNCVSFILHPSPSQDPSISHDPSFMLISLTNTGVEIPAQEMPRIFDKFYRIPNHDPWKHGGTGLGLALVRKLAERLGAMIEVRSSNRQTTFILWFRISVS
ncbi:PAS domain-containing protein [Leptothermofonsia sichuanensis E412]|uniref:sensor histidine kinase n=1 Tax=Leptothermofonsia sichuanensis TaxID=2917832 RepID=UPI001CA6D587|nr:PAS domain-containing protein [Leptothermofonsia sichuanensis]QZZ20759.1 PAS domain-containing protein [Leptothermofonsia sichuanensis E412]